MDVVLAHASRTYRSGFQLGADPHSTAIRPLSPAFPVTLYAITRADETPPHTLAPLLRMLARQAEERLRAVQM